MNLASRLQKYAEIGRLVSAVIAFAWSNGSFVAFTQMLRVPLNGLRNDMNWPSGEICAPAISGSPKNRSRSMIGGRPPFAAVEGACAGARPADATSIARPAINEWTRGFMHNS